MAEFDLYRDIVERTGGDIYLGVVGPVRTGKSTFIKKFMELLVIPNIENEHEKNRAKDELPQSSGGRTIMTTEPKFIPEKAVTIKIRDNLKMNVKVVDCVGYTVSRALGYSDERGERLVSTPWFEEEIPFQQAAEYGTKKVITEHSTIGIVITTDGSVTDLDRSDYIEAEERVVKELLEIGKPFVMILNTVDPNSDYAMTIRAELEKKYGVPVLPINIAKLSVHDINTILEEALYEFPIVEVKIQLPKWVEVLEGEHWLKDKFDALIKGLVNKLEKVRDLDPITEEISLQEHVHRVTLDDVNLGKGEARIVIECPDELFYKVTSEKTGLQLTGPEDLLQQLQELVKIKKEYSYIKDALEEAKATGYGVVPPLLEEMTLDQPEIIRHGSRFGVKLRASAPSIHMIRVDVESEYAPIVGSEKQSEDLVNYIMEEFEDNPEKIWESHIFGKSLYDLVKDGIQNKLNNMPPSAREKLQETLEKIINEGSGGLIAIIL
ncbi:stage IV sporulation protein A [Anaerobranca gottschalkii]|uniref:Stage IV sporulation protein A n=1 Tax=Anaerobranca gottschalkii DSM 13577 TaxID=1120990 RepID=A0A1H9YE98_9FIRM|nr:stage IV sporulation protein A [Anaerobranca gottschalkii]SES67272.1 stage IV sporulation protein A [Anaerobranca gottschalkii DSM 13577]